ncbi:histidine kinase [Kitasatospora sp. NBC_01287]|uniref:histidine kinase n=1 Tax=Kitasatospora sp. NBC_01287 TaxID=2903573 RepID=UPI002251306F|nr:histidine kinase [Kitasatospora sp. NBC_01287]MCX4745813.1 histidine kinase [Kitasatospora sp. NBC_01287]
MNVDRVGSAGRAMVAVGRCAVLAVLSAVKPAATVLPAALLLPQWVGALGLTVLLVIPGARVLAVVTRALVGRWEGRPVAAPYLPLPALERTENGWYWNGYDFQRSRLVAIGQRRLRLVFIDPATWREVAWLIADPLLGALVALPVALVGGGAWTVLCSLAGRPLPALDGLPRLPLPGAAAVGVVLVVVGVGCAPLLSGTYLMLSRRCLSASEHALLTRRASRLFTSRVEVLTAQAAELRRIERDLHDGAQARLVAIGMAVSSAELLFPTRPEQAMAQLAKARELTTLALRELREVVHSIHPPVLAERGLTGAVEALAIDAPMPVKVTSDLAGRLDAAVESAGYFAVAELLTNTAKHARAQWSWVEIGHRAGALRIVVGDDGRGGLDPQGGTGLRGLERRLRAFDGSLQLDSGPGRPTRITVAIPCAAPVSTAPAAATEEPGTEEPATEEPATEGAGTAKSGTAKSGTAKSGTETEQDPVPTQ